MLLFSILPPALSGGVLLHLYFDGSSTKQPTTACFNQGAYNNVVLGSLLQPPSSNVPCSLILPELNRPVLPCIYCRVFQHRKYGSTQRTIETLTVNITATTRRYFLLCRASLAAFSWSKSYEYSQGGTCGLVIPLQKMKISKRRH